MDERLLHAENVGVELANRRRHEIAAVLLREGVPGLGAVRRLLQIEIAANVERHHAERLGNGCRRHHSTHDSCQRRPIAVSLGSSQNRLNLGQLFAGERSIVEAGQIVDRAGRRCSRRSAPS